MWKGINGDIAWTLDAHYYLGCGNRGGREREIVYKVNDEMSYQNVVGTLNPGGHPGSYNGQDAYNDMLVIDENHNNKPQRYADQGGYERDCGLACGNGLQRPADSTAAKRERERERMDDNLERGDAMTSVVRRLTPLE